MDKLTLHQAVYLGKSLHENLKVIYKLIDLYQQLKMLKQKKILKVDDSLWCFYLTISVLLPFRCFIKSGNYLYIFDLKI